MKYDQAQVVVEKAVIEGFTSLASALQWFWPAGLSGGKRYYHCPIPERNLLTYISAQFLKKDFLIFDEICIKDIAEGRMDTLALNHEFGIEVYIEAKGCFDAATGSKLQLTNDINRMLSLQGDLVQEHRLASNYSEKTFEHKFALVVTTCYSEDDRKWWEYDEVTMPKNKRADCWPELHELLGKAKSRWSVPLKTSRGSSEETPFIVYGLYALFERGK